MAHEKSILREYAEALLIAAIFLRFANVFVVQTFYIPSGSMEQTLLIGDHLFVNRFIYGPAPTAPEKTLLPARTVHRGDIVVFRSPENPNLDVVKRCIALPGDVVDVVDKKLYLNGKQVRDESFAQHTDPNLFPDSPFISEQFRRRDQFGPYTVPPDSYFCMGDNRDHSHDSRFWEALPAHLLKGRALLIYWSYGGETPDGSAETTGQRVRRLGKTALGFFTNTRWERTFRLIR
jgi:signal peptidase I